MKQMFALLFLVFGLSVFVQARENRGPFGFVSAFKKAFRFRHSQHNKLPKNNILDKEMKEIPQVDIDLTEDLENEVSEKAGGKQTKETLEKLEKLEIPIKPKHLKKAMHPKRARRHLTKKAEEKAKHDVKTELDKRMNATHEELKNISRTLENLIQNEDIESVKKLFEDIKKDIEKDTGKDLKSKLDVDLKEDEKKPLDKKSSNKAAKKVKKFLDIKTSPATASKNRFETMKPHLDKTAKKAKEVVGNAQKESEDDEDDELFDLFLSGDNSEKDKEAQMTKQVKESKDDAESDDDEKDTDDEDNEDDESENDDDEEDSEDEE